MSESRKQLGRVFLFLLVFAGAAFAQFEVAPDHFPGADEQPASTHGRQSDQRLAEQRAILAHYRAQIKVKTEQVVAASQALQLTSSGVEQMEAPVARQHELRKRLKSLASAIRGEEAALARLQREQAMKAQRRPLKHSAYAPAAPPGT